MIQEIKITSLAGRGSVTMSARDYRGYWLLDVDWGQVEGQHNAYRYYNQIGESIVSTSVNARPISIAGWVVEDQGTLRERCDFLNNFISPVEDYELEYGNRKIGFRPDSSVIYGREYKENNQKLRKFLIQGTAPYPLFTGVENTQAEFDTLKQSFRFPNNLGMNAPVIFGLTTKTFSTEITNAGGFVTGIIARIRFSGQVKNPCIRNLTTAEFLGVNRTFTAGETLEVCTIAGQKRITLIAEDETTTNLIKYRDYRTVWIQLQPGVNVIAVTCEDPDQRGEMNAEIEFTPLFLEVE